MATSNPRRPGWPQGLPALMSIRAVLFDVGDTLWHGAAAPPADEFRRLATIRAEAFLTAQEIAFDAPGALARACWEALENAMRQARETDRVEPDYGVVGQAAAARLGVTFTASQAAAFMDAIYVSGADGGKVAYPDARATLEDLRVRGFLLGVVTNRAFGGERFRVDMAAAGLDVGWDAISVSVEVGYLKPHPAPFEHALTLLGITASEAVMVGNSLLEDIDGAQQLGMKAAWKRSRPDATGVTPDFEFDDVGELLDWELLAKGNIDA
jgi:FMN phosphatase YigB (HAD superfamily)